VCAVAGGLLDWESNEEGADSELGFYSLGSDNGLCLFMGWEDPAVFGI